LDNYKHIELTEDEMDIAVLDAKKKKNERLKEEERVKRAESTRKALTSIQWDRERMRLYGLERSQLLFGDSFVLDKHNEPVFNLLCAYFSDDPAFDKLAFDMGIKSPSLKKGVFMVGNFGVGKTWLMKIFAKNPKQSFEVINSKDIAENYRYASDKETELGRYTIPPRYPMNDASVFFQPFGGLCIDDMGTEDLKNDYGNKKNVIGDIIEIRYSKGFVGPMLNMTSNLTVSALSDYYGGRVISRLREIVNLIELPGNDRRK